MILQSTHYTQTSYNTLHQEISKFAFPTYTCDYVSYLYLCLYQIVSAHTLLLMFISLCYFTCNARRDTAAEKQFDIVIQMTMEDAAVQRFKKNEMDEKNNF